MVQVHRSTYFEVVYARYIGKLMLRRAVRARSVIFRSGFEPDFDFPRDEVHFSMRCFPAAPDRACLSRLCREVASAVLAPCPGGACCFRVLRGTFLQQHHHDKCDHNGPDNDTDHSHHTATKAIPPVNARALRLHS